MASAAATSANAAYNAQMRKFINNFTDETNVNGFDAILRNFEGRGVVDPLNRLMEDAATPLMQAADKGNVKLFKYILAKGPDMKKVIMENLPEYTVEAYCANSLKEIAEMNAFLDELEAIVGPMRKGGRRTRRRSTSYKSTK